MSALAISVLAFVSVMGGALIGMALRGMLPDHHLSDDSKDVVKVVTGLMATLSALVLGLLIASAKSSFDAINDGFRQAAAKAILVDRALAQYGPDARELREALRAGLAARAERLFPADGRGAPVSVAGSLRDATMMERFDARLRALAPANAEQGALKARAEGYLADLVQTRWSGFEQSVNTTPVEFLAVLIAWLATMFAGFGLFAPRNATALGALAIGALAVSTAIFLIEEMGRPLEGLISVSGAPLREALEVIGR